MITDKNDFVFQEMQCGKQKLSREADAKFCANCKEVSQHNFIYNFVRFKIKANVFLAA